ncbi:general odorant-binding protein lush [Harmonia axyridis]|uniref:general odorant-binding protein lush n=1 Tax=Harmonia axyridis TaxID=115357 RepID=UPI001E2751C4|nr:general odorant-binding protein lush [Harmonia axyridis]XP_045473698.1 general odorant-binding protein lush [Harmonia axyridis]
MLSHKFIFLIFSICFVLYYSNAAFSEKQLASAKKMITNICKPRANATDEDLEGMRSGLFSRPAMCFINCVLVSNKWQNKDNTFNMAGASATMKMLPEEYHAEGDRVIETCKDAAKTLDDKCVSAMEIGKCFYENSDSMRKFLS